MSRLLALIALFLPALALAWPRNPSTTSEPSSAVSTLGILYTLLMMGSFLYVGWMSKRRVTSSDDYFAAGRSFGGVSNGLAMSSNYMSLATFLGFTALLWKMQYYVVALVLSFTGGFVLISIALAPALRRWGKYTSMHHWRALRADRQGRRGDLHDLPGPALSDRSDERRRQLSSRSCSIGTTPPVWWSAGLVVTAYVTIGGMYGLSYKLRPCRRLSC
ncbi:MAG: hypothetical protein R3F36_13650 [Candidatus Competibacteraceae bacterium]